MPNDVNQNLTPKLRFPEFRKEAAWKSVSLGDASVPVDERVGERKLTPVSISAGIGFVPQAEKFGRDISGNQYKVYTLVRDGDFVFNKGNSLKFPQGCVYELKGWGEVAAPNVFICFRLKDGYSHTFFQSCFERNLHGLQLRRHITSGARSNGLLNISKENFFGVEIPTPSPAEQQKIAECLSALDELMGAESQKLDALKALKKGLMQQIFPRAGETRPRLRFPEFQNAPEWEVKPLGQVATYENGKAHENNISEDGQYVVVNSKFVSTEGEVRKYTNEAFCMAESGDVLMVLSDVPNGKAIAKCYYVETDNLYTVNQRICKIKPTGINGNFLYNVLDRNPFFLAFDDGVKQTNLRKEDVLNCPICFPSLPKEQKIIGDSISSVTEMIVAQGAKLEALKTHKKGLMQRIFPSPLEANP
jgi:type I restriction enzyme S subunit